MGFGIVNEVYQARVDMPQIRDLVVIVAGPDDFWSEATQSYVSWLLIPALGSVCSSASSTTTRQQGNIIYGREVFFTGMVGWHSAF